jgi:transcription antitermination factor NusG
MPKRWCALYTRARHEKQVDQRLQQCGVECFLPLLKVLSRWKDRKKMVQKPLFPGYLFVRIAQDQILQVLGMKGVVRILGPELKRPSEVPESEIQAIRTLTENGSKVDPYPYLKVGRLVRVKYGPLKGLEGLLVKKRARHRLVISVGVLRRSVATEICAGDVEPL